jgi:hypothetical protein
METWAGFSGKMQKIDKFVLLPVLVLENPKEFE